MKQNKSKEETEAISVTKTFMDGFWNQVKINYDDFQSTSFLDNDAALPLMLCMHLACEKEDMCTSFMTTTPECKVILSGNNYNAEYKGDNFYNNDIALLVWDLFDKDNTMFALRLLSNGVYDMYFSYFDHNLNNCVEACRILTPEVLKMIRPAAKLGLQKTLETRHWQKLNKNDF